MKLPLWLGIRADRGDADRLEAFSDGVLTIAATLLIFSVRVDIPPGSSLAEALYHYLPQIGAYWASFLQIGIIWANHHSLFKIVNRINQPLILLNLFLLGCVAFLPLPTRLVAEHTVGADARTAGLLYGGTLTACAIALNLIWRYLVRGKLVVEGVTREFIRDVNLRYLLGLLGYAAATLLAVVWPLLTLLITVILALIFALGPSIHSAFPIDPIEGSEH